MMLHPELLRAARPARGPLARATAVLAAVACTHLAQAVLLATALAAVARGDTGPLPALLGGVLAAALLRAVLGPWQRRTAVAAGTTVRTGLRDELLVRLGDTGPVRGADDRAGAVRAVLVDGVEGVDAYVSRYLPQLAVTCVVPPLLLTAVALVEPLAAAVLAPALLLALLAPRWWDGLLARRGERHWGAYEALSADYLEALQGMAALRAAGAVRGTRARLGRRSGELHRATVAKLRVSLVDTGITDLAVQGGTVAAVLVACWSATTGGATATGTYLLLMLASECFRPVRDLAREWHAGYLGVSAADGITRLRTAPAAVPRTPGQDTGPDAAPGPVPATGTDVPRASEPGGPAHPAEGHPSPDTRVDERAADSTALDATAGEGGRASSVVLRVVGEPPVSGSAVRGDGQRAVGEPPAPDSAKGDGEGFRASGDACSPVAPGSEAAGGDRVPGVVLRMLGSGQVSDSGVRGGGRPAVDVPGVHSAATGDEVSRVSGEARMSASGRTGDASAVVPRAVGEPRMLGSGQVSGSAVHDGGQPAVDAPGADSANADDEDSRTPGEAHLPGSGRADGPSAAGGALGVAPGPVAGGDRVSGAVLRVPDESRTPGSGRVSASAVHAGEASRASAEAHVPGADDAAVGAATATTRPAHDGDARDTRPSGPRTLDSPVSGDPTADPGTRQDPDPSGVVRTSVPGDAGSRIAGPRAMDRRPTGSASASGSVARGESAPADTEARTPATPATDAADTPEPRATAPRTHDDARPPATGTAPPYGTATGAQSRRVRPGPWTAPPTLRFEDVHFTHPGATRPALAGVDFTAPAGRTTAVVGPSGAGKSTLLGLLLRHADPDRGRVLADGRPLAAHPLAALRRGIAVVAQETYLFHASVADNLRLARPGATDGDLRAAARAAAVHDEILALPHGYDTLVGERGATLSGGQRQRIALARALLADAPVLVLDEATSAVHERGEAAIVRALTAAARGRTCLVVAHRLAAVRHADRIVVLDAGRVDAVGDHTTLLAAGGVYARLAHAALTTAGPAA
ncbi:ATP-binding cassette domain-containing protein [Streptomyces yaizuensis]|uniref:ATP-binding cassette domain-containing protein n=1 Tax=Streptomyces yaizuensis TaxID=2989713 RepID=A0ABQ5NXC4_9ACTN|nr:ATP-binding cassette domain-containing protein [Streptomyces sp. YSPA8]GLF95020.1 hypothetical protein SYYSPA8_12005 [Streptomyces sp. YSPA8]